MIDTFKDQLIHSVFRIRKANTIMRYKDMDLTTFALMCALESNQRDSNENIYLSELSKQLCITKAALSQMANQMEEKGYLNREINKSNRRKVTVTLTEKGQEAIAEASVEYNRILGEIISRLGDDNAKELVRLFNLFASIAEDMELA